MQVTDRFSKRFQSFFVSHRVRRGVLCPKYFLCGWFAQTEKVHSAPDSDRVIRGPLRLSAVPDRTDVRTEMCGTFGDWALARELGNPDGGFPFGLVLLVWGPQRLRPSC